MSFFSNDNSGNDSGYDSGYETPEEDIIKKVDKVPGAPKKGSQQCLTDKGWKFYKNPDVEIQEKGNDNVPKINCGK